MRAFWSFARSSSVFTSPNAAICVVDPRAPELVTHALADTICFRLLMIAAGDGKLFAFINDELLPYLHSLDIDLLTKLPNQAASPRQRIIGRIMTAVEKVRVD